MGRPSFSKPLWSMTFVLISKHGHILLCSAIQLAPAKHSCRHYRFLPELSGSILIISVEPDSLTRWPWRTWAEIWRTICSKLQFRRLKLWLQCSWWTRPLTVQGHCSKYYYFYYSIRLGKSLFTITAHTVQIIPFWHLCLFQDPWAWSLVVCDLLLPIKGEEDVMCWAKSPEAKWMFYENPLWLSKLLLFSSLVGSFEKYSSDS